MYLKIIFICLVCSFNSPAWAINDCAFDVLGLERTSAIQALIDRLEDPVTQRMIAVDYANYYLQTTLTDNQETLRDYLTQHFLHGDAMPGYYPGAGQERHGGILVALAHVHQTEITVMLRNRLLLGYRPENRQRTVMINHVAADPNYPQQLNHYEHREACVQDLPLDTLWEIFEFSSYLSAVNFARASPLFNSVALTIGLVKDKRLGTLQVPKVCVRYPLEHFSNPPVVKKAVGSKQRYSTPLTGTFNNWVQASWYTMLMSAIARRTMEEVIDLIRTPYGALDRIVSWSWSYFTALEFAASNRDSTDQNRQILSLLGLQERMELIGEAARDGNLDFLRTQDPILLNTEFDHVSPLLIAVMYGQLHIVRWFLDNRISFPNSHWTLATAAAYYGQLNILEWLFKRDSRNREPDSSGYTVVTAAVAGGHIHILEYLRDLGHNVFTGESLAKAQNQQNVSEWYANLREKSVREQ